VTEHDQFLKLIELIYDAALDSDQWPEVMKQLSRVVGSESALFRVIDEVKRTVDFGASHGYDEAFMQQYQEHFVNIDPILHATRTYVPCNEVWPSQQYISPDEKKGEFYNEYLVPQQKEFLMGFHMMLPGKRRMVLGGQRSAKHGGFEAGDVQLLQRIVPHFQRAFNISSRFQSLGIQCAASLSILEELPFGVMLLSANGAVQFMNAEAEAHVTQPSAFTLQDGRLFCSGRNQQGELDALIYSVLNGHTHESSRAQNVGMTYLPDVGQQPLRLHAIPLNLDTNTYKLGLQPSTAALFIYSDGQGAEVDQILLSQMYGLTPAESQLAAELVKGRELAEISEISKRSKLTLRTQLKAIFRKLGIKRQSELVRMLASSMTSLRQRP